MLQIRIQMNTNLQQSSWILPVTDFFKPFGIKKDEIDKRSFLKLSFANKSLDDINLGNILHHKSVKYKIPPYFKDQSVPIISYVYTKPTASKFFNYKHMLRDFNIDYFKSKPPDCTCASSPFIYNPTGHVIIGDLKIINNTCSQKGLNIVSLNPQTGNTTLKYLWIPSRIMTHKT